MSLNKQSKPIVQPHDFAINVVRRESVGDQHQEDFMAEDAQHSQLKDLNLFLIDFAGPLNGAEFLLDGWSHAEPHLRWAVGAESRLCFPPIWSSSESLVLTIRAYALPIGGRALQSVRLIVNNLAVGTFDCEGEREISMILDPKLFMSHEKNIVSFQFRRPGETREEDKRPLTCAFRQITLAPTGLTLYPQPVQIPRLASNSRTSVPLKETAAMFQSLGQNCEFGLWQRRCGSEALGLLRFSSIFLDKLLQGIRTEFVSIDDPSLLSLEHKAPGAEYIGHHKKYGLYYHTFRNHGEIDYDKFRDKESPRLGYLARMLIDQIRSAEKIFVVQRPDPGLTIGYVLPLFLAMREYNPEIKLLFLTAVGDEFPALVGRVERLSSGLFHGFIDNFAPAENAHAFNFDVWTDICCSLADLARLEDWPCFCPSVEEASL